LAGSRVEWRAELSGVQRAAPWVVTRVVRWADQMDQRRAEHSAQTKVAYLVVPMALRTVGTLVELMAEQKDSLSAAWKADTMADYLGHWSGTTMASTQAVDSARY